MELKLQTVVPTCAVTADERREVHYQHKHECRAAQWLSGYRAAKESTCWCATRFLFHNKLHTNVDQNRMKTLTLTVADLAQNKNTKEPTPNERCCHTCSTNTSVFFSPLQSSSEQVEPNHKQRFMAAVVITQTQTQTWVTDTGLNKAATLSLCLLMCACERVWASQTKQQREWSWKNCDFPSDLPASESVDSVTR